MALLLEQRVSAEVVDKHGTTPLHLAAEGGFADICAQLLEADLSVSQDVGK